ncbi:uncharacterized protein MELLADRAFT_77276 [Melampsora larici-populina 98AG31]|uniref:JmjC domain-containing protein n=1 Tax=Melampsora larici-populina (strain 98AG31 / pathotype 3-4-7) TaxID=747676 RepID=F4RFM6_MELLP|nr:uncharacterized protein MELLADRAFT_77276 [Melampsora larici-populina 98AG31]EGG08836.1 hypothetical protein MELLADRAFT_77276 [Melampsora larici-populina 98AG31]
MEENNPPSSSIDSSSSSDLTSLDHSYQNEADSNLTLKHSLDHQEDHQSTFPSPLTTIDLFSATEHQPIGKKTKFNKPISKKTSNLSSNSKPKKKSKQDIQSINLISETDSLDSNGQLLPHLRYETQKKTCLGLPNGLIKYRCSSCIRRQTGSLCSFVHIRSWIYSKESNQLVGGPLFEPVNRTESQTSYRLARFPMVFNQLPTLNQLIQLRQTVGKSLKPVLQRELIEYQNDEKSVRFIGRRIDVLTRCDYCSVTLIGVAWMCQRCGNEACVKCFKILKTLSDHDQFVDQDDEEEDQEEIEEEDQMKKLDVDCHSHWIRRLRFCVKWFGSKHDPSYHIKISHLTKQEILNYLNQIDQTLQLDSTTTTPPSTPFPLDSILYSPSDSESEPYYKIDVGALEYHREIFHRIWSTGVALVVTGMDKRMNQSWDSTYLRTTYGEEPCRMLDSNLPHGDPIETNVGDFFERFEDLNSQDPTDWPPETDFKMKFPELFEDFQKSIPIAEITSRNGFQNLAAHFPENANIPDIGPKALWHLYHAKDTEKLRQFLYDHNSKKLGIPVEEVKRKYDDPIHTTRTYIDVEMRKQLWEEYGVKGYEIKQKPGEAVFIPAYTAHQVCNLANCIKVAADFVSPTSIERCMKLKDEFRTQLHEHQKPWRDDVLQIDQMLLYAFDSLGRNLEEFKV